MITLAWRWTIAVFLASHVSREISRPAPLAGCAKCSELTTLSNDIAELKAATSVFETCSAHTGWLYWFLRVSVLVDLLVICWVVWSHYRPTLIIQSAPTVRPKPLALPSTSGLPVPVHARKVLKEQEQTESGSDSSAFQAEASPHAWVPEQFDRRPLTATAQPSVAEGISRVARPSLVGKGTKGGRRA